MSESSPLLQDAPTASAAGPTKPTKRMALTAKRMMSVDLNIGANSMTMCNGGKWTKRPDKIWLKDIQMNMSSVGRSVLCHARNSCDPNSDDFWPEDHHRSGICRRRFPAQPAQTSEISKA